MIAVAAMALLAAACGGMVEDETATTESALYAQCVHSAGDWAKQNKYANKPYNIAWPAPGASNSEDFVLCGKSLFTWMTTSSDPTTAREALTIAVIATYLNNMNGARYSPNVPPAYKDAIGMLRACDTPVDEARAKADFTILKAWVNGNDGPSACVNVQLGNTRQ